MTDKLYIGAKLMLAPFAPTAADQTAGKKTIHPCTVVYINFPHRYFTAMFEYKYGSFSESFKFLLPGDTP